MFLSRRTGEAATEPVSVPEGSKLTVRVVSREPAEVVAADRGGAQALAPGAESRQAGFERRDPQLRAVLDRDATVAIAHADGTTDLSPAPSSRTARRRLRAGRSP